MFIYNQHSGDLWEAQLTIAVSFFKTEKDIQKAGAFLIGKGYSGQGKGRDNPAMEGVHNVGPIPAGWYHIGELECIPPQPPGPHGPYIMRLGPQGHNALGRSGFLMHGDNAAHDASQGCIIMPFSTRYHVGQSSSRTLLVGNFS